MTVPRGYAKGGSVLAFSRMKSGVVPGTGDGDTVARAEAAVVAGCDVVLTCNDFAAADDLLSRWTPPPQPELARRWARMAGK